MKITNVFNSFSPLQRPNDCIGMSVSGGIDSNCEEADLPVFVSAVRPGSAADLSGKVQVREKQLQCTCLACIHVCRVHI